MDAFKIFNDLVMPALITIASFTMKLDHMPPRTLRLLRAGLVIWLLASLANVWLATKA